MRNTISKLALAAACTLGAVSSAHAGFSILTLRWSPTDFLTCDSSNFAACNDFSLTGQFTTTGSTGAFSLTTIAGQEQLSFGGTLGTAFAVSTQVRTNSPGTPLIGRAFATSTQIERIDALPEDQVGLKTLVVDFISYGFTNPTGVEKLLFGSAGQNAANPVDFHVGDKVETQFTVDSSGSKTFAPPALPDTLTTTACSTTPVAPFSTLSYSCTAGTEPWTDPIAGYSLRAQQAFIVAGNSRYNATAAISVTNVPEPMTTALVGIALAGMALVSRRGSKKA